MEHNLVEVNFIEDEDLENGVDSVLEVVQAFIYEKFTDFLLLHMVKILFLLYSIVLLLC